MILLSSIRQATKKGVFFLLVENQTFGPLLSAVLCCPSIKLRCEINKKNNNKKKVKKAIALDKLYIDTSSIKS